jgi:hypothetical protein
MTVSDRQQKIREHLTLTSSLNFKSSSSSFKLEKSRNQSTVPVITPDNRKKTINEHLARSTSKFNFNSLSFNSQQRQQQIKEHIRLSKGFE